MSEFTKVEFNNFPKESGAYNVTIISRDGFPVIRVMYFDKQAYDDLDRERCWIVSEISEYGYFDFRRCSGDYIYAWKKIEGVEFSTVPETMTVSVKGAELDEDE